MKGMRMLGVTLSVAGLISAATVADQTATGAAAATQAAPAAFDPSRSDARAVAIIDKVMAAMGGDAWNKARYIKFTWVWQQGERNTSITHHWDRFAQRSRMEGPSREGKAVVAVVDHRTKQGEATLDGEPTSGDEQAKYVELAYNRLINDSYWFFMQYKLKDPGVRLRYEAEIKAGPVTYDKIQVSFDDGVGNTPGDKYWIFVNRGNSTIERWSYILQGSPANTSPVAWEWTDWQTIGGLKIATRKTQPGGESSIFVEGLEVLESLPETLFTSALPAAGQSGLEQAARDQGAGQTP